MWNNTPVIFEDEDEAELKARFIDLWVRYPNEHIFTIASHVFKLQKDPETRSQQAALIWSKDLEVKEAVRQARLNGDEDQTELTKESLQRKLIATTEDESLDYREKKVMIEGYLAIAEINGWKIKAIDKKTTTKRVKRPITIARYPNEEEAENAC